MPLPSPPEETPPPDIAAVAATELTSGAAADSDLVRSVTPLMGIDTRASLSPRVLIVEDDTPLAEAVATCLGDHDYHAMIASSGREALEAAREWGPALAIVDVQLPDMDGFALAEAFAADRKLSTLPVLFASGIADLPNHVRRLQSLACDFLRKPYGSDELIARVERGLAEARVREQLRRVARFDELTGLGNLRLLEERMAVESARLSRYGTPFALVVADLDGLKRINDAHGHLAGSAVLRAVGDALRAEIRETDLAVRYGGDEFVVLLPHTPLGAAQTFAERLLRRVGELRPEGISISVSIGIGAYDPAVDASLQGLLARTDAAAYRAKRNGGGQIAIAAPVAS